jgi:acetyltransferase-like isoleucine patch superfamily enzyme
MRRYARSLAARLIRSVLRLANEVRATEPLPKPPATSNGTVFEGYTLDIRAGSRVGRVTIGSNSVLCCRIVLERSEGSVSIGDRSYIGSSAIICAEHIAIGSNVLISWGCTLVDHDSHSLDWRERARDVEEWRQGLLSGGLSSAAGSKNWDVVDRRAITVADKVWIGMNATILKGVTVGEGAVIAAGSIVTKDVAPWTLVGGNPARAIRELPAS